MASDASRMRKIWWSWDLRMRWSWGFCGDEKSFLANYTRAIDAAARYGVEGIVVWGFLRDSHGGVDAARRLCDHGRSRGVSILPGVGIDAFGGVYCSGDSPHSLDRHLREHPERQARREDGRPSVHRWPPADDAEHLIGCPSDAALAAFYRESLEWLVDTFDLAGFQIEQGDVGLCFCERCRALPRTTGPKCRASSLDAVAARLAPLIRGALASRPGLTILVENYSGLLPEEVRAVAPFLADFPPEVFHSWQAYDCPGKFHVTAESRSPTPHGCMAVRSNSDFTGGEIDDRADIRRAVELGRAAGLDMTYTYGEYPDDWPVTRGNYAAWAGAAAGSA